MIVYHNINLLCWPLLLVVSIIDLFLLLVAIRLLLETFKNAKTRKLCCQLKPLTDPIPQYLRLLILRHNGRAFPSRVCWAVVIGMALLLRYLILHLIT